MSLSEIRDSYAEYADWIHRFERLDRLVTGRYRRHRFGDVTGRVLDVACGTGDLTLAFADILAGQLRQIDAAVVQIDEPHLPGHPEHAAISAAGMNRMFAALEPGVRGAVHLCFGNFGGQMTQRGHNQSLIDFLNLLECDYLILETTRRSPDEIAALKEIKPELGLGLGVIDVKDLQVESAETVAQRIEALAALLGKERVHYVHPDCGLQVLPRPVADGKLHALVAGRNLFLGKEASL